MAKTYEKINDTTGKITKQEDVSNITTIKQILAINEDLQQRADKLTAIIADNNRDIVELKKLGITETAAGPGE